MPEPSRVREVLRLLRAAPPAVLSEVVRARRLELQSTLLASLPDWAPPMPFTIYWRHFFSWSDAGSDAAIVAYGVVQWNDRVAAFTVDVGRCTQHPAELHPIAALTRHLALRAVDTDLMLE